MGSFIFYIACVTLVIIQDTVALKPRCPENEIWLECAERECERTCKAPAGPHACNLACIPGCNCKKGYFRDSKGRCVLGENCDNCRGDPNAYVAGCGDPCPDTCFAPRPFHCKLICLINGCKCRKGYILGTNGKCVRPYNCGTCGRNEVFDTCARCPRDRTCEQYLNGIEQICPLMDTCIRRCRCISGYYRNHNGECVHRNNC